MVHTEMAINALGYLDIHPGWYYTIKTYCKRCNDLYDMFDWCDQKIGKCGEDWDFQVDRFLFLRGRDCTYFTLRW